MKSPHLALYITLIIYKYRSWSLSGTTWQIKANWNESQFAFLYCILIQEAKRQQLSWEGQLTGAGALLGTTSLSAAASESTLHIGSRSQPLDYLWRNPSCASLCSPLSILQSAWKGFSLPLFSADCSKTRDVKAAVLSTRACTDTYHPAGTRRNKNNLLCVLCVRHSHCCDLPRTRTCAAPPGQRCNSGTTSEAEFRGSLYWCLPPPPQRLPSGPWSVNPCFPHHSRYSHP